MRIQFIALVFLAASVTQAADIRESRQTAASKAARAGEAGFRELYKELVEINTTLSVGSCTKAAEAMAIRLRSAGFADDDMKIIAPKDRPQDGNLVAYLEGTDTTLKPVLLLAHIDVVEADRADWERDPFKLIEEDGFFYARGASDDKAMAAVFTDSMVRFKKEGFRPKRGIKLALTCGEESPNVFNGVKHLIENHRDLIDAEFALNEGGGGRYDQKTGVYKYVAVLAAEKVYQDFTLTTTNAGGHSSRPMPENAIYQLNRALAKIEQHSFPIEFNETARAYFEKFGAVEGGQKGTDMIAAAKGDAAAAERLRADPSINAILHTNCVATQIHGGHAPNALPQRATANVNCRIYPGHKQEGILTELVRVIGDPGVKVDFQSKPETPGAPPPLSTLVMKPIEQLSKDMFPGVAVIPTINAGATDCRFLTPAGIACYGVSGMLSDGATSNAHGLNERIRVQTLLEGREFLHRLTKMYAGGK
ncbi:MAG: M20/M25/M40 family metallo-hydrolase, partial [Steroidobacteraceae bacterium]|nr:M20/M25/M40 family metallo-hydrolase [Steroidobacteraceae bacterium]